MATNAVENDNHANMKNENIQITENKPKKVNLVNI
jgi:hypothetical protein